jgi:lipopolysaccharide assembly protein A
MNFKLALILILAALVTIFIVQNVSVVEIRFLFWNLFLSRALLIFCSFIIGVLSGWVLHSYLRLITEKK